MNPAYGVVFRHTACIFTALGSAKSLWQFQFHLNHFTESCFPSWNHRTSPRLVRIGKKPDMPASQTIAALENLCHFKISKWILYSKTNILYSCHVIKNPVPIFLHCIFHWINLFPHPSQIFSLFSVFCFLKNSIKQERKKMEELHNVFCLVMLRVCLSKKQLWCGTVNFSIGSHYIWLYFNTVYIFF